MELRIHPVSNDAELREFLPCTYTIASLSFGVYEIVGMVLSPP